MQVRDDSIIACIGLGAACSLQPGLEPQRRVAHPQELLLILAISALRYPK